MLMIWGEAGADLRAPLLSMHSLPNLLTALGGAFVQSLLLMRMGRHKDSPKVPQHERADLNPGPSDSEARVFATVPGSTHGAQLECSFIIRVTEAPGFLC